MRELVLDPPLCWCCATWGLTVPAIVADKRLCRQCLTTPTRAQCGERHYAEALGIADEQQPELFPTT